MFVALQQLHAADLIGQYGMGSSGFKRLARASCHSQQQWQVH